MDPRFPVTRDEFHGVQMDLKQLQSVQNHHAERLLRLEKRQAGDAAIKSVWNSPFPSAIGGTPQHGPLAMPPGDMFDDFEEHGQNLLGSLHLDAEDEPARRGAASRANSVRFDESALQSASWGQNGRPSGDFGPIRPGSGLGSHGMERTYSHKSDGRHSSAGHSVHSIHSHHSAASGRGSSLGLDTNFVGDEREEDSPSDVPEPPPGFFALGSVPSIIRCWLTPNFAHDTLLYADICTGSQKSVLEFSLVKELDLLDDVHRDLDGTYRIRLPVYLTEATVTHSNSRGVNPAPQMPSLSAAFEVVGMEQSNTSDTKRGLRIFIGSETLREHSADVLFSQNLMTLYGSEREKLSVPFVRPEDSAIFKNIRTIAVYQEKPKLNATARPFVLGGESRPHHSTEASSDAAGPKGQQQGRENEDVPSPGLAQSSNFSNAGDSEVPERAGEMARQHQEVGGSDDDTRDAGLSPSETQDENSRRESTSGGIWSSWRQGTSTNGSERKDNAPLSGYQPAGRGGRNMKVLKPTKLGSSSSARTGAAYEPPPPPWNSGEPRRKSQTATESPGGALRWEPKRTPSGGLEGKSTRPREPGSASTAPRTSANPVGGASAFSWMTPTSKAKAPTAASD